MNKKLKILAVIPARGGSKGIPRKNIRILCGKPLIQYSIENAIKSQYITDIAVTTDDTEIKTIASQLGVQVIDRPQALGMDEITLDPVIYHAVCNLENKLSQDYDIIITMQPTSPLLTHHTLDAAIKLFIQENADTMISVVNNPHLAWTRIDHQVKPLYEERLNRQQLPPHLMETGAFLMSKRSVVNDRSRIGHQVTVFEIPAQEAVDIDTMYDWWICENQLNMKNIIIRTDGYREIGLGHIYRAMQLAYRLTTHNVLIVLSEKSDLGIAKIKEAHLKYAVITEVNPFETIISEFKTDIILNDILNTTQDYMAQFQKHSIRVVNFEDLGEGAAMADAVINDLYGKRNNLPHHYWGEQYYLIRDEFLYYQRPEFREKVENVLVLFGGTDPSGLTEKILDIVLKDFTKSNIKFTFVVGLGYDKIEVLKDKSAGNPDIKMVQNVTNMAQMMAYADIAISSQGRTMMELSTMGIPTIILAHNSRELEHEFGGIENGFINLGLGADVEDDVISQTLHAMIADQRLRREMHESMLKKDFRHGFERILPIILGTEENQ